MDKQEEAPVAQAHRSPRTWSLVLEVDGMPIAYDATLRHYHGGHAGLMAEALQQPLLLPRTWRPIRVSIILTSSFP